MTEDMKIQQAVDKAYKTVKHGPLPKDISDNELNPWIDATRDDLLD